jgi:hypothetical protein
VEAAVRFCESSADDFAAVEGSISMDIPVEFVELHELVKAWRDA